MRTTITRRIVRANYARLNRREVDAVVARFAPDVHFRFGGDHPLGVDVHEREGARAWFGRLFAAIPDLRFEVEDVMVGGFPWHMHVATRYTARGTGRDGRRFGYAGVQLLRLRWGRVTEDLLYPDTQVLAAALAEP